MWYSRKSRYQIRWQSYGREQIEREITRNDIQFNKDLHNERQSAPSTPKNMSFQEKVHVRQGEPIQNEIPRKQDNEVPQTLRLEDKFSKNSKKNEGSSNFLYKEKIVLFLWKIRMAMILLDQLEIQGIHMMTEIMVEERIDLWLINVQVNAKLQRWTR